MITSASTRDDVAQIVYGLGIRGVRATSICPGMVDTRMVEHVSVPEGQFKIEPEAIAESVAYALSLPNNASVAEVLVNSRYEAML